MAIKKKTKNCSKCNQDKPLSEYYYCRAEPDGLYHKCKKCCKTNAPKNAKKQVSHYSQLNVIRLKKNTVKRSSQD